MNNSEKISDNIPDDICLDCPPEGIRSNVAVHTQDLLDEWTQEEPFVVHAKTGQSTGKTTGVMDTLESRGVAAIFGPRHDDINDDADRFSDRFVIRFIGRDKACENNTYKGHHKEVTPETSREWCDACPKKDGCGYFQPYEQLQANTGSFTAVYEHLEHFPHILKQWPAVDAIAIDESPWHRIFEKREQIRSADIGPSRSALRKLRQTDLDQGIVDDALRILDLVNEALSDVGKDSDEQKQRLTDVFETVRTDRFEPLIPELTQTRTKRVLKGNGYTDVICLLHQHVPDVVETREWAENNELTEQSDSIPIELFGIHQSAREKSKLVLRWRNAELAKVAQEKPVFVLATEMPTESVRAMFDLPVVTITDTHKPEVEVIQLDTLGTGIARLRKRNRTYENLLEFTELAIRRERLEGKKTFIALKKELRDDVRSWLNDRGFVEGTDYELGFFYGITGSNRFEDCGAFVCFGAPGLPPDEMEASHLLSGVPVEVLKEEGCTGEARDALHRIRPIHMPDTPRAYIFTNAPDFSEDFAKKPRKFGTEDLRTFLKDRLAVAERWDKILTTIDEFDGDPTITDLVDCLPFGHGTLRSDLNGLVKKNSLERYTPRSDGRGRPPRCYRRPSS